MNAEENFIVEGNIDFEVPETLHMLKDLSPNDKVVNWQEYHPVTEEEVDQSYTKLHLAPDYSSEIENYKKE